MVPHLLRIRHRQTCQWRSGMAPFHRHGRVLSEWSATHLDRLVRATSPALVSRRHRFCHTRPRARARLDAFPSAPRSHHLLLHRHAVADRRDPHRQLHLPQLFGSRPRHLSPRRSLPRALSPIKLESALPPTRKANSRRRTRATRLRLSFYPSPRHYGNSPGGGTEVRAHLATRSRAPPGHSENRAHRRNLRVPLLLQHRAPLLDDLARRAIPVFASSRAPAFSHRGPLRPLRRHDSRPLRNRVSRFERRPDLACVHLPLQAAKSLRGSAHLRALSTALRLESVVRFPRRLAFESYRAAHRRAPPRRQHRRARAIRRKPVSAAAPETGARRSLAILVYFARRKAQSRALVAPPIAGQLRANTRPRCQRQNHRRGVARGTSAA